MRAMARMVRLRCPSGAGGSLGRAVIAVQLAVHLLEPLPATTPSPGIARATIAPAEGGAKEREDQEESQDPEEDPEDSEAHRSMPVGAVAVAIRSRHRIAGCAGRLCR